MRLKRVALCRYIYSCVAVFWCKTAASDDAAPRVFSRSARGLYSIYSSLLYSIYIPRSVLSSTEQCVSRLLGQYSTLVSSFYIYPPGRREKGLFARASRQEVYIELYRASELLLMGARLSLSLSAGKIKKQYYSKEKRKKKNCFSVAGPRRRMENSRRYFRKFAYIEFILNFFFVKLY